MKQFIEKIRKKENLTFDESKSAFEILMEGKATDEEIYDFLKSYKIAEEVYNDKELFEKLANDLKNSKNNQKLDIKQKCVNPSVILDCTTQKNNLLVVAFFFENSIIFQNYKIFNFSLQ